MKSFQKCNKSPNLVTLVGACPGQLHKKFDVDLRAVDRELPKCFYFAQRYISTIKSDYRILDESLQKKLQMIKERNYWMPAL